MNDLLKYLSEALQTEYPTIAGVIAILMATGGLVWKLTKTWWTMRRQRRKLRDLFPFYTEQEIQHATQYYVETTCQTVDPSKDQEPGRTHAYSPREPVIPFFLEKALKPSKKGDDHQFYMILGDSGMGKTTFLINLYLRYYEQFWGAPYQIKLLPLGYPKIDEKIDAMSDEEKKQTVLLLDAFDEDIHAVRDYKARMRDLIGKVLDFRDVVITCRTQFFPSEAAQPKEVGVLRFGGAGGERVFRTLYLSPFDEQDISTYLRQRFPWFQGKTRRKARQIVQSCLDLVVRPMLLNYIEDLLQRDKPYTSTCMVYTELIQRWIDREVEKAQPGRRDLYRKELQPFSRKIAVHIYTKRQERDGSLIIPGDEIQHFAEEHGIHLLELEMKSRSLLNRNARGDYKFSHKSILEYFLAEEAYFNADFRKNSQFEGMDQAKTFLDEMIWEKLTVPFFSRGDLSGEYRVSDGKPRVLTKLTPTVLRQVTSLKLQDWNPGEDEHNMLALSCLPQLKNLELSETQLNPYQRQILRQMLPDKITFHFLRSNGQIIAEGEALKKLGIHAIPGRPLEYIQNDYKDQGDIVFDLATGLLWQKAGSPNPMTYQDAQEYVKELNRERFAGHDDWRLPTIPELMSLLEPEQQSNNLYLNPIFDSRQFWCWSSDRRTKGEGSSESAWHVYFYYGFVSWNYLHRRVYVRAVRSRLMP